MRKTNRKKGRVSAPSNYITPIDEQTTDNRLKYYILGLFLICTVFYIRIIIGMGDFWEDLVFQEYPNRIFARNSFLHFVFPHWNPYSFNGMPFFASMQAGVLYPFNVVLSFLPVDNGTFWYFIQLNVVAHFFFAGVSMFFFARSRKLTNEASFFAATGYMLCGFFVTHVVHSMMLYILAWLPLVVLFIEKGIHNDKLHQMVIAGILLGISSLAGHPQIFFYECIFLFSYSLYVWFSSSFRNLRHALFLLVPFGVAIGFASILLLPAIELSAQSVRTTWTFNQASEGSLRFAQLLTFLMPKLFGAWTGPGSSAPPFWLSGPNSGYYTYWDTCFYTGVAIVIFALIQFRHTRKDPFVRFSLVWGIAALSIACGSHFFVYKLLFNFFPGFDNFRAPARILFTLNFLLPILAAQTLDELDNRKIFEKILVPFLVIVSICVALGIVIIAGFPSRLWPQEWPPNVYQHYKSMVSGYIEIGEILSRFSTRQALTLLLNIALLCIPVLLVMQNKLSAKTGKNIIICLFCVDLFIFGFNQHITNAGGGDKYFSATRATVRELKKVVGNDLCRINTRQFSIEDNEYLGNQTSTGILRKNQGMVDNIQITEGFNALNLAKKFPPARGEKQFDRFLDLLNIKIFINPDSLDARRQMCLYNADRLPRAKMFYRYMVLDHDSTVKKVMAADTFDYRNTLMLTNQPRLNIQGNDGLVPNEVTITDYTPNKITLSVSTEKNGLLWMSEIWYPAWKAFIDGKETQVFCADYCFRAIEVPQGTHDITFVYSSGYFNTGLLIFILTLLSTIGYLAYSRRKQQKQ